MTPEELYAQTMAQYQQQYNAAKSNRSAIAGQYNDLFAQQAAYGQSQQAALNRQYDQQLGTSQQSMVSRGLGNSTALDSAARGINYDRANSQLTLQDQLLQRQNTIKQAQLGYLGDATSAMTNILGQEAGYSGQYAANTQAQQAQSQLAAQQQAQQLAAQKELATQQYGFQRNAAAEGFGYQLQLNNQQTGNQIGVANNQFRNTQALQNEFGYYAHGGYVMPHPHVSLEMIRTPYMPRLARGYADGGQVSPFGYVVQGQGPGVARGYYASQADADAAQNQAQAQAQLAAAPLGQQQAKQPQQGLSDPFAGMQQSTPSGNAPPVQSQYGYAVGGPVGAGGGMPGPTDTVPAYLTPGEFVLSRQMIQGLEAGELDKDKLLQMIRAGRAVAGGYCSGGMVK